MRDEELEILEGLFYESLKSDCDNISQCIDYIENTFGEELDEESNFMVHEWWHDRWYGYHEESRYE